MSATKTQPYSGIGLIAQERAEQIFKHGFTIATDQSHYSFDAFRKAAVAILECDWRKWPHHDMGLALYHKIMEKDKAGQVAVAGALLAAEIDYLHVKGVMAELSALAEPIEQETKSLAEVANIDGLFIDIEAGSNTVKSELIQDLYATYLADKSESIVSPEHTTPFTFEAWLNHHDYIDSRPSLPLLTKDRIQQHKDAYKGTGYVEPTGVPFDEHIDRRVGGC